MGLSRRAIPAILVLLVPVLGGGIGASTARGAGVVASTPAGGSVASGSEVAAGGARRGAPFTARLLTCRRSPRIAGRVVAVAARMRPIAGATHLSLRIELSQRPLAGRRWTLRGDVPGLGIWTAPSDPSLGSRPGDVFAYHQAVGRLVVPFAYRFRVGFRWRDDAGQIVREAAVTTRPCREPDLRPDLTLPRVRVQPSLRYPALARYVVEVRNGGRSTARSVAVAATFPGRPDADRTSTIARVRAGDSVAVSFLGPRCNAADPAPPSFTVDPANAIEEADETNNTRLAACAAPS